MIYFLIGWYVKLFLGDIRGYFVCVPIFSKKRKIRGKNCKQEQLAVTLLVQIWFLPMTTVSIGHMYSVRPCVFMFWVFHHPFSIKAKCLQVSRYSIIIPILRRIEKTRAFKATISLWVWSVCLIRMVKSILWLIL